MWFVICVPFPCRVCLNWSWLAATRWPRRGCGRVWRPESCPCPWRTASTSRTRRWGRWPSCCPPSTSSRCRQVRIDGDPHPLPSNRINWISSRSQQAYHVTDAALGYFSPKQSHSLSILRLQSCWELTNHGIVNIGKRHFAPCQLIK